MTTNKTIEEMAEEYAPLEAGYSDYDYELHQTFLAGAAAQKELSDAREVELMAVIEECKETLILASDSNFYWANETLTSINEKIGEIEMTHITGKVYDMTQENFKKLTDELESAQAKIKELEGSVATIPYDEMKESMLRLYKQQVPRLNDIINEKKACIEKLEQANKIMREALVRIEPEHYNATRVVLRYIAHEALNQVKEILGE